MKYVFMLCLLISSISVLSQSMVTDSTTVFNMSDTKKIRSILEDHVYESKQLPVCEQLNIEYEKQLCIGDSVNMKLTQIIQNKDKQLANDTIIIDTLKTDNIRLMNKNKSDLRKFRLKVIGVSVVAIILVIFT